MILVRDVFRLKFGAAREAQAAMKHVREAARRSAFRPDAFRVLTDLVGPYYTIVVETTLSSLSEYEQSRATAMSNQDWRDAYQKFSPHVESGYREIFTILE